MSLILAAADGSELIRTLDADLSVFGHHTRLVRTGRSTLDTLDTDRFDIAVIDLLLPDIDGYEVARQIRRRSEIPIIALVECLDDIDDAPPRAVSGFVLKPVEARALDLRIVTLLRESADTSADKTETHGDLVIDRRAMTATVHGRPVTLTRSEWLVLSELSSFPGRVYSRDELFAIIWGIDRDLTQIVDASVHNLRSKLESEPAKPRYIKTIRGFGYRFGPVD